MDQMFLFAPHVSINSAHTDTHLAHMLVSMHRSFFFRWFPMLPHDCISNITAAVVPVLDP